MKKLKKLTTLLLSVMLIVGLVSCGTSKQLSSNENSNVQSQENNDSHYPVTITTYNYLKEPVEITFDKAPERVVAIYQNSIETLLALGLEDKIVAAAGLDHDVKLFRGFYSIKRNNNNGKTRFYIKLVFYI